MLSDFYKAHPEVLKKKSRASSSCSSTPTPWATVSATKSAPILKLDDIKGKKLGFEGGGLRFETMQALGASVVGMNMSDLYQAMQGGIIDGIVMDFDPLISGVTVRSQARHSVEHHRNRFYVVMNQKLRQPAHDLKAIVDDIPELRPQSFGKVLG